jgi:formate hydrogenlyase subunit 3/multisubunit Na+/H+ antiporter MnhD subunit
MSLELLLIIAFGGALLTYFFGKISSKLRNVLAVLISLALVIIIACLYGVQTEKVFYHGFFGLPLILRLNSLSWFFAAAIASLAALSIIYSLGYMKERERTDYFYLMMLLINAGMLGIVLSGDLVSFFIFWEIMSWSTFLLISYNKGKALLAGEKYIIMSLIGSMCMLVGILSIYTTVGSLNINTIASQLSAAASGYKLFLLIIFTVTFGIKNAVVPFHIWLPDSYTEAPAPFTAVLSGMLTRMGVFGFLLIMYVMIGAGSTLHLGNGFFRFNNILAWLGAITIVIPTFIAMLQDDAKRLLAWSSIGQGGYMILGISFGTSLGVAGGIFHTLNHATYIVLLFLSVGIIQYWTKGLRDFNSLGGFFKKMPVAFLGAFLGICGLIGIPLTNGFVSKWLIFKTLILGKAPFLAFAALLGTWGTILAAYKFLHNLYLGQLPAEHKEIKKAPMTMQIPVIILSVTILLFGILPGLPLKVINSIVVSLGFNAMDISIWGIASETGTLNTLNIFVAVLIIGIIIWSIFKAARRAVAVEQSDNYAAGSAIPAGKYSYTVNFYNPLDRMIRPYLKDFVDVFYLKLAEWTQSICDSVRRIYTGYVGNYVMYIVLFMAFLILIQLKWSVF